MIIRSMNTRLNLAGILIPLIGLLCLPAVSRADTQAPPQHRVHKSKKQLPPPLPSGTRGPVPQVPLDALPAVPPQVSYQDGLLTIVAPNSTLSEILRGVRKHTSAEIDIPAAANERVATHLGPGPAREVLAELLNGSRFNYILLGSPTDSNQLVRVVLVAKSGPDTPASPSTDAAAAPAGATAQPADAEPATDDAADDNADQGTADADQDAAPAEPGVKTPQQMLQEMQQRQLLLQQQQQSGQTPVYPAPNGMPMRPQAQQNQ